MTTIKIFTSNGCRGRTSCYFSAAASLSAVLYSAAALLCLCQPAHADSAYEAYAQLSNQDYLTAENFEALQKLEAVNAKGFAGHGLSGSVRRPGEVVFAYGTSRPEIICQVLELTDIGFKPGEIINSVQIGDGARWSVQSALSGTPQGQQQHLIVKPFDSGLKTWLLVTTNERTYHLALKSSIEGFMPMVRFAYPEDAIKALNAKAVQEADYKKRNTIAGTNVTVDKLNFNYELDGDEELKPLRVFNDGAKTFIELKPGLSGKKLPALLVVNQEGGLFSEDKLSIANYRVSGARFILDGVPSHLRLILGDDGGPECDIKLKDSRLEVRS